MARVHGYSLFPRVHAWGWAVGFGIDVPAGGNVLTTILVEQTPLWFASLVIAGAMAAFMSSADSMVLSVSSYITRDIYRPYINPDASSRREDAAGRGGIVVLAIGTYFASLLELGSLIEIGIAAFTGFAQLALPVLVALYRHRTTKAGIVAGITGSQALYMSSTFIPLVPTSVGGWGVGLIAMVLGFALTGSVSLLTTPTANSKQGLFRDAAD